MITSIRLDLGGALMLQDLLEKGASKRRFVLREILWCALGDDAPAVIAAFWA